MNELDINQFLKQLEENYSIFDKMFNFNTEEFLSLGDSLLELNTIPDVDIPFSALEYLKLLRK